jgi:5-methylthioadenosine/S-adenosylhomocysteine deaminase
LFLHGSPKPSPKPGQKHFSEIPMPRSEIERLRKGRFATTDGLVTMGLAILGPYYSVHDVTRQDVRLAREFDLIASMHVGGGVPLTPDGFDRLGEEGLLGSNLNVVHGNDLSDRQLRMLVDHGVSFTVTADIELQMGYGDPLTGRLKELDSPISVGSDVEPAVRGDMFGTMRLTLQHERHRRACEVLRASGSRPSDIPVTAREALEWTTVNAAKSFRIDRHVGSLAPGKQADIVLLDADGINMFPVYDAAASVVMQAGIVNVDTVLVAGCVVKRNGKLLYGDLARRKTELKRSGERIMAACGLL